MYVPNEAWSLPEDNDPPPCFRQGDLVLIDWIRWEYADAKSTQNGMKISLELRKMEIVALVGTCCDLVLHRPPKRKGFLVSPLKGIPKHLNKPAMLEALKAPLQRDPAAGPREKIAVPNLIYYSQASGPNGTRVEEGVIYLEALTMIDAITLEGATKLAELTKEARSDFKERLKWHFSRGEA